MEYPCPSLELKSFSLPTHNFTNTIGFINHTSPSLSDCNSPCTKHCTSILPYFEYPILPTGKFTDPQKWPTFWLRARCLAEDESGADNDGFEQPNESLLICLWQLLIQKEAFSGVVKKTKKKDWPEMEQRRRNIIERQLVQSSPPIGFIDSDQKLSNLTRNSEFFALISSL